MKARGAKRVSDHIHNWVECPKCGAKFCMKCEGQKCPKGHSYYKREAGKGEERERSRRGK